MTTEQIFTVEIWQPFIDPALIKLSDWPSDILPPAALAINQVSENGDYIVKGFYCPATGELHIQEVAYNTNNLATDD